MDELDKDAPADDPDKPETRPRTAEDGASGPKSGKSGRAAEPVSASAPIIKQVEISGATGEDQRKAQSVLHSSEGERLNPNRQREDIRKLYELGLFKPNISVKAEKAEGGVKLVYQVEPNPKVNQITVKGNSQVTTEKILSELPVKVGQTYTIQAQDKIRADVARYYDDKGFTSAMVSVEERLSPGNTVDLIINVDEGTKTKINEMILHGNNSIRDIMLKMRASNKGSWGPFKHYFNESRFQKDMDTIKAYYAGRGWLDVDVRRGEFVYAPDKSWVSPVIEITEGPRYKVGRVDARGYTMFNRDEVLSPFKGLQGDFYSFDKFNSAGEKVKNMYGDEGFMLCKVDPDFHKDTARGVVDVDVVVNEGPRIYVGDVKIVSQTFPDDADMSWLRRMYSRFAPPVNNDVIRREVKLRPGQVYRRFEEVKTRERLQSLNVFDEVKVGDQLAIDNNVRDCVVDVKQGNTGNLIFGVGFGDVEGGFLYANYVEHNLFGMARDLRVSGMIGSKAQSFSVSYLDRYFLDSDISAKFDLFHTQYQRTGSIRQSNTGTMAEFTRPLDECLRDSVRLRLEAISFKFDSNNDEYDEPKTNINNYVAATVRYRLTQDTRDSVFFPTTGHILSGGVEIGAADGFLAKFEGQYAAYFCLGDNWVFAMNNQLGFMPYNSENIGYADRFFLGGSQDMRGFKLAGAGPHDSRDNSLPIGGSTKWLSQFEARYPFTDSITGVLFADVGTLGTSPFSFTQPRLSVGPGARLRLPIAQVAVDLGVPIIKYNNDQTQILHFTMQSCF